MSAKTHKIYDVYSGAIDGLQRISAHGLELNSEQIVEAFNLDQSAAEIEALIGDNESSFVAVSPYRKKHEGKRILMIETKLEVLVLSFLEQRENIRNNVTADS